MDRISELQYKNLRRCFYSLLDAVLGPDYYNEAMDIYNADEMSCRDVSRKLGREKQYDAYLSLQTASHKPRSVRHVLGKGA